MEGARPIAARCLTKSTSSRMGTASSCAETTVSDELLAAAFAASSHIATIVAIRHPLWGDVSVQLPVPKAPLHAKRAANQRFALSTLFAILQLKLLYPPLNLGNRPRVLEQFAEGIPLALGEVDGHTVVPELKRKLRTTFLFG